MLTARRSRLLYTRNFEPMKRGTANLNRMPGHPAMPMCAGWLCNVATKRARGGGGSKP